MDYIGTVKTGVLTPDTSFVGPVAVPDRFVGMHTASMGYRVHSGPAAAATVSLDSKGVPVVTMTQKGSGYNSTRNFQAVVFSGGDATIQATGCPVVSDDTSNGDLFGHIESVIITSPGNYKNVPPTISFPVVGGPNIPAMPNFIGAIRTHDFRGSGSKPVATWNWTDDGNGNYDFSVIDEVILWHGGLGKKILFNLYGTPAAYATSTTYTGLTYGGTAGSSCGLNALGKTEGTPGVGLWGYITALMKRYNQNAHLLINPITGQNFSVGTKLINFIEVWNEPQFGANGTAIPAASGYYWIGTASELVDIARIISKAAKAIDPDVQIMGCGFINTAVLGVGTAAANLFYNFMVAVDSVEGKRGIDWIDVVSIHPYDSIEVGNHFQSAQATRLISQDIATCKRAMQSLGVVKPICASEWGFYFNDTVFKSKSTPLMQTIQIKRVFAEHALLGLHSSFAYSWESEFLGSPINPVANPYTWKALIEIGAALNNKIIVQVNRRIDGAIQLIFSDGTSYFTG